MRPLSIGIQFWNQAFGWEELEAGSRLVDGLGYDHLWSWEHPLACIGDPHQPTHDPYAILTAWAGTTRRVRLGLLTGANTLRNPALVVKSVISLDHISRGRAILGLGAGWFEEEHRALGIEFGDTAGERLGWLEEAARAAKALLRGEEVTSEPGGRYRFSALRVSPLPIQANLPVLIGGTGERKTLRTVAQHADIWNMIGVGDRDVLDRKIAVLRRHCDDVGRDPDEIERSVFINPIVRDTELEARRAAEEQARRNHADPAEFDGAEFVIGTPDQVAERILTCVGAGFSTIIAQTAAPLDEETIERLQIDVLPLVEAAR